MANTNIPSTPLLVRLEGTNVRVSWGSPVRRGHTYRVYAAVKGTLQPFPGPAVTTSTTQEASFSLTAVPGNSPPNNDVLVAVSSYSTTTHEESAQGTPLLINVHSADPGLDNLRMVARDQNGDPTYLATDEDGNLVIGGSALPVGAATEAKQDAAITQLTEINAGTPAALGQAVMAASQPVVVASDQTDLPVKETPFASDAHEVVSVSNTSVALPSGAPLANRRLIAFQNKGNTSVFIISGTADATSWEVAAKGSLKIEAGPTILFEGYRDAGTADVLVWEFA